MGEQPVAELNQEDKGNSVRSKGEICLLERKIREELRLKATVTPMPASQGDG